MANPLPKAPHDLAVVDVPPKNPQDSRVPMAEQFALNTEIVTGLFRRANDRLGWISEPVVAVTGPRQININGIARTPNYPTDLLVDTNLDIPPLPSATTVLKQDHYLSLVGLAVDVGAEHDASLNISFQFRSPTNQSQVSTTSKENARRLRAFWLLVLSPEPLTTESFIQALPLQTGDRRLSITETDTIGFDVSGQFRAYARDSFWVGGKTYVINPEYVDIAPICIVRRIQNFLDRGYTFGNNGEEPLNAAYNIARLHRPVKIRDHDAFIRERLFGIFAGKPGAGSFFRRTVQNLTSGAIGGNSGVAGEAAGSPDGSVCLANDQRSGFSNESRVRKWTAQVVSATNDGNGRGVVIVSLNTNAPIGTRFSESPLDHKIYAADGTEQSSFGRFTSLGSSSALTWVAASGNNAITPGSTVYVVPGVYTPPGTGFSVPFTHVEKVWRNGVQIASGNVRLGWNDLTAFENPANEEEFIVVLGPERQALHYIYRRIYVTTNAQGIAFIPPTERGVFAFIQGVTGRIDKPLQGGLTPNTVYPALVYYPPRSLETWQFQFRYPDYQGLTSTELLNNARVATPAILFAHTLGAGGSVFQGSEPLRYTPVASNLPAVSGGIPAYSLNAPIQLAGETSMGAGAVFRELQSSLLLAAAGLTIPQPGQRITLAEATTSQGRSIKGKLLADGTQMGVRAPVAANGSPYQLVLCFCVEKNNELYLVIMTRNTRGAEDFAIDSDQGTAFDIFRI